MKLEQDLHEADTFGLRFDSHDDALNFAAKQVEDSKRWQAAHELNIAKHYASGNLELCLKCAARFHAGQFHLVFSAIPYESHDFKTAAAKLSVFKNDLAGLDRNGNNDRVFVGITEFVQCPEKIVPSFVWLESANEILDFYRDFFTASVDLLVQAGTLISEGKSRVVSFSSSGDSSRVTRMIERGSQAVDCVKDSEGESLWHRLNKLDLVNFLGGIRICLDDRGARVRVDELSNLPFEISDLTLCLS